MSQRNVWLAFLLLSITWGTSFLFIKVALVDLHPSTLVALRLTMGVVALLAVVRWRNLPLPRQWDVWRHLGVIGALGVAIPFVLISWAEQHIDSGLTAVLNSTVPLFSIIVAGVWMKQETVTLGKIVGLVVGFLGVVLLFVRELQMGGGNAAAPLAVMFSGLFYAVSATYARHHLRGVNPIITATGQVAAACLLAWLIALVSGLEGQQLTWPALGAVVWLGLLGSALAYILFYYILAHWGPTRSALVTYVIPLIAVTIGAIFLNEQVDWHLIAGGLLILSGVGAVNSQQ